MKMKLYYVVEVDEGFYSEGDYKYVSGPFNWEGAREACWAFPENWKYRVVGQTIEVD